MENETYKEVDFEKLSLDNKIKYMQEIINRFNEIHNKEVIEGKIEVVDVTFNKLSDGRPVFDIIINEQGKITHQPCKYTENIDELYEYRVLSNHEFKMAEKTGRFNEFTKFAKELKELPENESIESLSELVEESREKKELENIAFDLGINSKDVEEYAKINAEGELAVDNSKLNNSNGTELDANERITSRYSLNNVFGTNYKSFKIIKTADTAYFMGVNYDDTIEYVDPEKYYIDKTAQVNVERSDGSLKEVSPLIAFRVKDFSSKLKEQVIGLYRDEGYVNAFYGRSEQNSEILAKDIAKSSYNFYENAQKRELDITENRDISKEVETASIRAENGIDSFTNILDNQASGSNQNIRQEINDTVDEYLALGYNIQSSSNEIKEKASEEFDKEISQSDANNLTNYQIVNNSVKTVIEKEEKKVIDGEEDIEIDSKEEDRLERKDTPWGNPNI